MEAIYLTNDIPLSKPQILLQTCEGKCSIKIVSKDKWVVLHTCESSYYPTEEMIQILECGVKKLKNIMKKEKNENRKIQTRKS